LQVLDAVAATIGQRDDVISLKLACDAAACVARPAVAFVQPAVPLLQFST
jgi:hypothetical protein